MKIITQLEFNKYVKLMYFLSYRKPVNIIISLVGILMIAVSVAYYFGFDKYIKEKPTLQLLFGVYVLVFFPGFLYYQARRSFNTKSRLWERVTYEFTDEKIDIFGESFSSEIPWDKVYRVEELKNWILLYQTKLQANLIPKESFVDDQLEEFRKMIRSKGIRNKFKKAE